MDVIYYPLLDFEFMIFLSTWIWWSTLMKAHFKGIKYEKQIGSAISSIMISNIVLKVRLGFRIIWIKMILLIIAKASWTYKTNIRKIVKLATSVPKFQQVLACCFVSYLHRQIWGSKLPLLTISVPICWHLFHFHLKRSNCV